ncbi:MAG TPA: helix-turn-helix transcriptional regulator [Pseudomonadales bacterium]|nr:helix-turn-helix transcriptional regulator [Pseudomonadales bacterium]
MTFNCKSDSFATRLKAARKKNALTQSELGKLIGVSKVSICLYESGRRTPDMETLQKISDSLNVSIDHLVGRDGVPVSNSADPQVCQFMDELLSAPKEWVDELQKIWEILKKRSA